MCGRYSRRSDKQRIAEAFTVRAGLEELYLEPDAAAAPGSVQPVAAADPHGERQIEMMRWGFKMKTGQLLFNARSEGIEGANFWKESFSERRCIVPADSFFEWMKQAKGKKPKYEFTSADLQPFGMAGLWRPWKNEKTGKMEDTFAILTTEANAVMRPIHDRQPAILERHDYAEYLSDEKRPPLHLIRILSDEEMKAALVSEDPITTAQASLFDSL